MAKIEKIYQEIKEKLEATIISKLFELPAFRLNKKKAKILETYALNHLVSNISSEKFSVDSPLYNIDKADRSKRDADLYNFRGAWKQVKIILKIFPARTWTSLTLSILFAIIGSFLVRQNDIFFQLTGVIFLLVFSLLFFSVYIKSSDIYILIQNTFVYLRRVSKDIRDYINYIYSTNNRKKLILENQGKIEYLSELIVKEFIKEEISQVDFSLKEIYLSPVIFAFFNTFMAVWIAGDQLVYIIKEFIKIINLIDAFPIINNLNLQTFSMFFLFPFSIACGRYIRIEALRRRSNDLHRSLFLLELDKDIKVEGWLNSSTTTNRVVKPKDRLSSLWQKVDELGVDENKPTMAEITAMVKEVRHSQNEE